jgi:hypothetical protein
VRAPEALHATRVVAAPSALDALTWPDDDAIPGGYTVLRLAPDDLLVIAQGSYRAGWLGEPSIQEDEAGFVGWWLTLDELHDLVLEHVDWPLPATMPALSQGLIAGVPAKLWLSEDRALLLCAAAYGHELQERLS